MLEITEISAASSSIPSENFWTVTANLNDFANHTSTYNISNHTDITIHNETKAGSTVFKYYPIIAFEMVLSCLCLIMSLIVYCILPEFRNVHGRNLITLSSCLLVTFFMLILDLIFRNHVPFAACFSIAMIIHVTFLATFFWTNIMSFDIWRTITNMKAKSEVKSTSRKYFNYSIYAWTATILTALPAAVLELTDWVPDSYKPHFGVTRCWLSGGTAFVYYFNLPVGVILFGNLVMFLLTIRKLYIIKKMTEILSVKQHQKRLNLYLKLFLVMGITWFSEFLPWITGIHGLYALAGMLMSLHGVLLFVIFVCKKRTIRQAIEKLRHRNAPNILTQNSSSQQTTVSSTPQSSNDRVCDLEKTPDTRTHKLSRQPTEA